jgi:hypothetical protein
LTALALHGFSHTTGSANSDTRIDRRSKIVEHAWNWKGRLDIVENSRWTEERTDGECLACNHEPRLVIVCTRIPDVFWVQFMLAGADLALSIGVSWPDMILYSLSKSLFIAKLNKYWHRHFNSGQLGWICPCMLDWICHNARRTK